MIKKKPTNADLIKENENLRRRISNLEKDVDKVKFSSDKNLNGSKSDLRENIYPDYIPIPYYSLNSKGMIVTVNQAWCELFGFSSKEVKGKPFVDFLPLNEKFSFEKNFNLFLKKGKISMKLQMIKKKGASIKLIAEGKVAKSNNNKKIHSHFVLHEIKEQFNTQHAIINESNLTENYFDIAGVIMLILDKKGNVKLINKKGCYILGWKRDQIIGKNWYVNFIPKSYKRQVKNIFAELSSNNNGGLEYYESPLINIKGEERIINWLSTIIRDDDGNINGFFCSGNDVTEEKETVRLLIQSKENYKRIFENASDGITQIDKTGRIIEVNSAAARMFGDDKNKLVGKHFIGLKIFSKRDIPLLRKTFIGMIKGKTQPIVISIKNRKGEKIFIESSASIIKEGNIIKGVMIISRDITLQQKAEDILRDSKEKYESIFHSSPLGIFHFTKNGEITHCNDNFVEIIGSTKSDLIGLNLFKDIEDEKLKSSVKHALKTGSGYYQDNYKSVTSNKETPVRVLFSITRSLNNKITGGVGIVEDISERKKAEEALLESEARFRNLANSLPQIVYEADIKGRLTYVNDVAFKLMGYSQIDLDNGLNVFDMIAPEDVDRAKTSFSDLIESKTDTGKEFSAIRKDGSKFKIEIHSAPIFKVNKIVGLRGIIFDITERKKSEEIIRRSEEKFSTIFNSAPDGIVHFDIRGNVLEVNPALTKITNLKREDVIGMNVFMFAKSFLSPKNFMKVNNALKNIAAGKDVDKFEVDFIDKIIEITIPSGTRSTGVTAIFRDITKSKKVEELMMLNSQRQGLVLKSLPLMFYTGNPNNEMSTNWISDQVYDITGFKPERFIKDRAFWTKRLHPEHRERVLKEYFDVLDKDYVETEYMWKCADGNYQWFIDRITITRDDEGNPKEGIGVWLDITENKKAEGALRESEETLRVFINAIPETALLIDADLRLLAINKTMSESLGLEASELIGQKITGCIPKNATPERIEFIEKVFKTGNALQFEDFRDGKYYMNYINPVHDSDGRTSKIAIFAFDLTDRKLAEEAMLKAKEEAEKSNRLKSEFLAQMSHEIRTPINTILSFSNLIESTLIEKINNELMEGFSIINSASKRVTRTIDLILNMSEIQTGTYEFIPRKFDLFHDVLENLNNEFRKSTWNKGLKLKLISKTENTKVVADEYSISQIFANLIDNAIKYTKKGHISITVKRNKNNVLVVSVADTGVGISKEYLPKLFEPFSQETQGYTRKFDGNGLGLALVRKYCEYNNVDISVKSVKGVGTTFTLEFNTQPNKI